MSLIHRYKSNGFNIVLDINSGCIHLVDEVTYEVLPYLEEGLGTEAIAEKLENKYNRKLKSLDIKIDGDFADHLRFQTNSPFQAPYRPAACFSFS